MKVISEAETMQLGQVYIHYVHQGNLTGVFWWQVRKKKTKETAVGSSTALTQTDSDCQQTLRTVLCSLSIRIWLSFVDCKHTC